MVLLGFELARLTTPRDHVFLIGTPIERAGNGLVGGGISSTLDASKGLTTRNEDPFGLGKKGGICGAPTRSGRPCSRRVKGGGFCWQHRDKVRRDDAVGKQKAAADRVL
jgi:hypothetical protein